MQAIQAILVAALATLTVWCIVDMALRAYERHRDPDNIPGSIRKIALRSLITFPIVALGWWLYR